MSYVPGTGGAPDGNDITRLYSGVNTNITGTANNPIVNVEANPTFTALTVTTLTSGATEVSNLFARIADVNGANTNITLHTAQFATKANLSGASFTGAVTSGGTDLSNLFGRLADTTNATNTNTLQSSQLVTKANLSGASFTGAVTSGGTDLSNLFGSQTEVVNSTTKNTLQDAQLLTRARLSGATFTGTINTTAIQSGGTDLSLLFATIGSGSGTDFTPQLNTKANLSGASFTGAITSGGTDLSNLFGSQTEVVNATTKNTLQDAQLLTRARLSAATFTGTVNMPTIQSGGTDLSLLFATIGSGGADYTPQLATKANLSGASFTGGIQSGGTDLSLIFATIGSGTGTNYTPQLNTKADLSGATFTGTINTTTIQSGGTDLSSLFAPQIIKRKQSVNITTSNINPTGLSGLTFTYAADSIYVIDFWCMCTSAAATTGYAFAFYTDTVVNRVALSFTHQLATGGTVSGGDSIDRNKTRGWSSGVVSANTISVVRGSGMLHTAGNTGMCQLRFAPEVSGASVTCFTGSTMIVQMI